MHRYPTWGLITLLLISGLAGCNKPPQEQANNPAPPAPVPTATSTPAPAPPVPAASSVASAPEFEFALFKDHQTDKLSSHFGKPLVVNFWAVWCGPCKEELPDFQQVYNAKKGQFELLGICVDDQFDPPGFVKEQGYSWQFAFDHTGSQVYRIQAIPRTLFINAKGELVDDHEGAMSRAEFEASLSKIL